MNYVVKPGDTLWGISNQYGVNVSDLAAINNITGSTLRIGQVLKIPNNSGNNPDNMFMYTVKKGDSLWNIARTYGTSVEEIKRINYLTNNNLYIGQVIRIPEMYTKPEDMVIPNYINYKVVRGDTLYSIAKKYGVSVDTIISDNALKSNVLNVGDNLKIRTDSSLVEECFGEEIDVPSVNYDTYTVVRGDSLYSIAKRYNTSVSDIIRVNNLSNNNLSIGQILKIPGTSSNTYKVLKGDTLYSIARKFNVSVDSLKSKNNLTNNNLSVGQILKI